MRVKLFLKRAVKAVLPYGILVLYRYFKKQKELKKIYGYKNYCPICRKAACFRNFNTNFPRAKAQCPHCLSLERHRLLYLFLQKRTDIFSNRNKKILHVAAEPCFIDKFEKIYGDSYLTADLINQNYKIKMDIMNIQYPNETFDIIICNHVLEHVSDDKKAMGEFRRVLKNNGWAILLVPVDNRVEKTFEDSSITTESGRLEVFGQKDHVRRYGRDYADRLKSVGFNVSIINSNELVSKKDIKKMGLLDENIYYCKK